MPSKWNTKKFRLETKADFSTNRFMKIFSSDKIEISAGRARNRRRRNAANASVHVSLWASNGRLILKRANGDKRNYKKKLADSIFLFTASDKKQQFAENWSSKLTISVKQKSLCQPFIHKINYFLKMLLCKTKLDRSSAIKFNDHNKFIARRNFSKPNKSSKWARLK